jgi:hypothetical protein
VFNKAILTQPTTTIREFADHRDDGPGLEALRAHREFFGCSTSRPNRPGAGPTASGQALQRDPRDVLVGHE